MPTTIRSILCATLLAGLLALTAGCNADQAPREIPRPDRHPDRVTIDQGVWGDVWFWEGDFMPGTPSGTIRPVVREVAVYQLTNLDDVTYGPDGSRIILEISTEEIARTTSDAEGFFQLSLPPGAYSVFAVEGEGFYANLFDGSGNILPVTVEEGAVADVLVNIDYMSTW